MAIVCSGCDRDPPDDARAGTRCPSCGEVLIKFDTTDELVGAVIDGRFEVLAPLGRGGMGLVYRARQLSIGREVALKVLDRRIERDVASVKRFFREAKVASTLAHPNTVPIIDFGQNADGRLFLVMELVQGRTLAEEIAQRGALPLARVITIGVQLCEALEVAHGLSIVHRDLKLENVMLLPGPRDHVKILDFGLARSLTDPSTAMTATGLISGTPRYMPPEVAIEAAAPEPSQDMYAVGVILAELAVGHALWVAPSLEALVTKKLELDKTLGEVPDPIRRVSRALLDNEPANRPDAAATRQKLRELDVRSPLALELDAAATDPDVEPIAPPPPPAPPRARPQLPTELEPTTDVEKAFANISLVALDERADAPPKSSHRPSVAPPMQHTLGPVGTLDDRFSAPREEPVRLEIDRADIAERESQRVRTSRATGHPPSYRPLPARTNSNGNWLVTLLVLAGLVVGGFLVYEYLIKRPGVVVHK